MAHTEGEDTSVCTKEDVSCTINIRKMYLPSIFNTHNFYVSQRGIQYLSVYVHANIDDYACRDGSIADKGNRITMQV